MNTNFFFSFIASVAIITSVGAHQPFEERLNVHPYDLPSQEAAQYIRVGIVKAHWNTQIVDPLFADCVAELLSLGVQEEHISVRMVPGSLELSLGAQQLFAQDHPDVCICLGAILEEPYKLWAESLAHAVIQSISALSTITGLPVICGVLICSESSAEQLVSNGIGRAWAQSALMMVS